MIPKIIHYCWFGGNPLPNIAIKCIASWKKYCPDYEIKEWNESNFDITCCDYIREASELKKWAFVSDYARFWILYHIGGLYFDTDVELIKPIDDIIDSGSYMGCELRMQQSQINGKKVLFSKKVTGAVASATMNYGRGLGVNPGLGLGVTPGLDLYKEILDFYQSIHYLRRNGTLSSLTVVDYTTEILLKHGWVPNGSIQIVSGVTIYPPSYFCPLNYETGEMNITQDTRSIHHYTASWQSEVDKKYYQWTLTLQKRFGYTIGKKLGRIIDFPHRVNEKLCRIGIGGTVKFIIQKLCFYRK